MSKYKDGEHMYDSAEWFIETFTNLDASSLSPFEETTISGMIFIMCTLFVIQFIVAIK